MERVLLVPKASNINQHRPQNGLDITRKTHMLVVVVDRTNLNSFVQCEIARDPHLLPPRSQIANTFVQMLMIIYKFGKHCHVFPHAIVLEDIFQMLTA